MLNTLLDFEEPGVLGAFADGDGIGAVDSMMRETGYLDASAMAKTFDALRANDLIWNYVSSGWLMGQAPPAFDLLAWNADSTRMPARMHGEYLQACYVENRLAKGTMRMLGRRIQLKAVDARHLLRRGRAGPHHAVDELLRLEPAARRRRAVHPQLVGPHRRYRQPARRPPHVPDERRAARQSPRSGWPDRPRTTAAGGTTGRPG